MALVFDLIMNLWRSRDNSFIEEQVFSLFVLVVDKDYRGFYFFVLV